MSTWIRVAALSEVPAETGLEVVAGDRIVALYRVGESLHALDGICPHAGGPLAKGRVVNGIVTCPWHGWQFHVCTGQHCLNSNLRHPAFATRVEGNDVFVEIPD